MKVTAPQVDFGHVIDIRNDKEEKNHATGV